VRGRCPNR